MKYLLAIAGLYGAVAVAMGAFTAHGLEKVLQKNGLDATDIAQRIEWATTATQYLMVHAAALLGLIAVAWFASPAKLMVAASALMALGTCVFCGSLFALAFTGNSLFARIAPWGGTSLIAAWLLIAIGGWMSAK